MLTLWREIAQTDARSAPPEKRKGLAYKDYYWLLTANAVSLASLRSEWPEICDYTDQEVLDLQEIGRVGLELFLSKITRYPITDREGEDVPGATFGEGDWTYFQDMRYARDRGAESPRGESPPEPVEGITLDASHTWQRLPKVLDVLSTHLEAAGLGGYREELDAAAGALVNYLVYRTVHYPEGEAGWPLMKNYSNWDGWYRVGHPHRRRGYRPSGLTEKSILDLGTIAHWNADLREIVGRWAALAASRRDRDVAFRQSWFSEDFWVGEAEMGVDAWRLIASLSPAGSPVSAVPSGSEGPEGDGTDAPDRPTGSGQPAGPTSGSGSPGAPRAR
jgi:hypothetical protein